jgi:hypothetical protein
MGKNIVLFGVIISLIAALLVPILLLETKASTCTSSASAGGVPTNRFQSTTSANLLSRQAPTRDSGCSSGSVAVGGQGTSCFAVNNGQSAAFNGQSVGQQPQFRTGGSQSCFASNQAAVARLPN